MPMKYSGDNLQFPDNSIQNTAPSGFGFKNRIINGAMMIDQRNAGASVTPVNAGYTVDRWTTYLSQASKITSQRDTTAPSGYTNSLKLTVSAAVTPGASDFFAIAQKVEGFNTGDLGFGTSSAQSVTLSFWVRSSVTGTYSVRFCNGAFNRSYIATYTVNSANTWEQKTINIAGDTSGTWLTNNGIGLNIQWDLGSGSNGNGTEGSWTGSDVFRTSGSTNWISNSGATFYITGVQLEKGSTATSFDYRPYGTELALCQRYLPVFNSGGANPAFVGLVAAQTTTSVFVTIPFLVAPRVPPTGISVSSASHFQVVIGGAGPIPSGITFNQGAPTAGMVNAAVTGVTAGTAGIMYGISTAAQIQFTGCEL